MTFTHKQISEHVYQIKDAFGVAMYLIIGKKKCCLLDTGYGFKGLKEYIASICDLPNFVILTHGHADHAMGCSEFDEVYMNEADLPVYQFYNQPAIRMAMIETGFHINDITLFQSKKTTPFLPLQDMDCFDLGDITLQCIQVSGHTKGTMMVLIKEERIILFGDACGPGTILIDDFSTDISTYYQALCKVKTMENQYDRIIRNHGTCVSEKTILDEIMELCRDIQNGCDDRFPLPIPKELINSPLVKADCQYYSAKELIHDPVRGMIRKDHKEGNISYRSDKS